MNNQFRASPLVALLLCCLVSSPISAAPSPEMISFWNDQTSSSRLKPRHHVWQQILDAYLITNHPSGITRFDYDNVKEIDEQNLKSYIAYLQQLDPRQLSINRQLPYWLNLYNASVVLNVIVEKPRSAMPRFGRGEFWTFKRFNIAGQSLSFDDIEHGIIRPIFNDARIHFVLSRATLGSGNLPRKALTAENLEATLDQSAREFLNHPRGVSLSGDRLTLSRVFKWFEQDFGDDEDQVKAFVKEYVDVTLGAKIERSTKLRYQFDWSLNQP